MPQTQRYYCKVLNQPTSEFIESANNVVGKNSEDLVRYRDSFLRRAPDLKRHLDAQIVMMKGHLQPLLGVAHYDLAVQNFSAGSLMTYGLIQ